MQGRLLGWELGGQSRMQEGESAHHRPLSTPHELLLALILSCVCQSSHSSPVGCLGAQCPQSKHRGQGCGVLRKCPPPRPSYATNRPLTTAPVHLHSHPRACCLIPTFREDCDPTTRSLKGSKQPLYSSKFSTNGFEPRSND